jgi:hypothetical protein
MPKYKYKNFNEYWYSLTGFQRAMLARLSSVSYNYLCRIARGDRKAGQQTITRLGKVDRTITPRLMRPDLAGKRKYVFKGRRVPRVHELPTEGKKDES